MKKKLTKAAAFFLVLALSLSLCACSMGLSEMLIVKRAYRHVAGMDSLSFKAEGELEASAASLPFQALIQADSRCIIDPGILYMDMKIDMGKLGTMELPLYLYTQEGTLRLMFGLGGEDSRLWFSSALPLAVNSGGEKGMDVETVLSLLQDDPEALSIGDSETVNGLLCRPFILKIPGSMLEDALGVATSDTSSSIQDMVLTIWISENDGSPVRLSADIASMLQYILENSGAPLISQLDIKSLPTTVDITGFNDVESIELPQAG